VSNDAGLRAPTFSTSCPRASSPGASACCKTSGWPKTRKDAEAAFDAFVDTYAVKYEKAAECLKKDRDPLLAFYDFPAEHLETPAHVQSAE
jgi:putative transposase